MSVPGSYLSWVNNQFTDGNGVPLAGGSLAFVVTGTSTPKLTFANSGLTVASTTNGAGRVTLDANGFPSDGAIFLAPGGYDLTIWDATPVAIRTRQSIEAVGQTFLATLGWQFAQGSKNVSTGYTILSTDYLVTANAGAAGNLNLCPAANRSDTGGNAPPLWIKNMSANTLTITPDGTETIDGVTGTYTLPAAASPNFPAVMLLSTGVSGWFIVASHGL